MISPEKGAETSIYLASSPEVEGLSGRYFVKKAEARSSDVSYDESKARRLWEVSAVLTNLPTKICNQTLPVPVRSKETRPCPRKQRKTAEQCTP